MALPLYLAMTAAEISQAAALPARLAYMACHFSPYGDGLDAFPQQLPAGAMLCINDRIPPMGQNPEQICDQVEALVCSSQAAGVLLDFQRAGDPLTLAIAQALSQRLSCPTGVSACYGESCGSAVFVSPRPWEDPVRLAQAWPGRALWLDAAIGCGKMHIDAEGARWQPLSQITIPADLHSRESCCHYGICREPSGYSFEIMRQTEDLHLLLERAEEAGYCCAIGLYQQLANSQKLPPPPP